MWVTGLARGSAVVRELKHAGAVQAEHPCLLENFLEFLEATSQRRLAIFLDYDGTLTPIVKNPDRAYMSDQVRCPRSPPPFCVVTRGRGLCTGHSTLVLAHFCWQLKLLCKAFSNVFSNANRPQASCRISPQDPKNSQASIACVRCPCAPRADARGRACCGAPVPDCHHQRARAREGGVLRPAQGAVLCRQPRDGHCRPAGAACTPPLTAPPASSMSLDLALLRVARREGLPQAVTCFVTEHLDLKAP